jgi:hypothetical protein
MHFVPNIFIVQETRRIFSINFILETMPIILIHASVHKETERMRWTEETEKIF